MAPVRRAERHIVAQRVNASQKRLRVPGRDDTIRVFCGGYFFGCADGGNNPFSRK
jgi:hypothetical protein